MLVALLFALGQELGLIAPPPAPARAPAAADLGPPLMDGPILDSALGTTRRLGEILCGPFRDAGQLWPGCQMPVEAPPDTSKTLGDGFGRIGVGKGSVPTWKYRFEAGGNLRQGNVSSTNFNGGFSAERQTDASLLQLKATTLYNQLSDAVANQRHFASLSYDWYLSGRWLAYARTELENDNARHIMVRSISSAGLGYRFLDDLTTRWVVRTGPTVTYLSTNPPGSPNEQTTQGGWLVESQFRRALAGGARFVWDSTLYPNFASQQAFRIKNDVAVMFPIGELKSPWNWKVGARHEYTDGPPPGTRPNDTEVYFAIVYTGK